MQNEKLSFWLLLTTCTAVSIIPIYPPVPLVWLCAALIWHHRYGPSWYTHDLNTDEDHIFIFDLIICLPLAAVMLLATLLENICNKEK